MKAETKRCGDCGETKAVEAFSRRGGGRNGYQPYCKSCYVERGRRARRDPAVRARQSLLTSLRRLGVTREDYDRALAEQKGRCAICESEPRRLHIDHDHATGKLRGLLCHHCNTALGNLRDDPERLRAAIRYLER